MVPMCSVIYPLTDYIHILKRHLHLRAFSTFCIRTWSKMGNTLCGSIAVLAIMHTPDDVIDDLSLKFLLWN